MRYSGILDQTGTMGSTIIGLFFLLHYVIESIWSKKISSLKLTIITLFYLCASMLVGKSGFLIFFIFSFLLLIGNYVRLDIKSIIKLITTIAIIAVFCYSIIYYLAIELKINGLMCFRVLNHSGFDGLLNHTSMKVLLSFYDLFYYYLNLSITNGGLFGSQNATGLLYIIQKNH